MRAGGQLMMPNPIALFREAVAKYPKIKPLFGLLAAVALLLIVLSTRISTEYAFFGVLIILALLVFLALAVGATQLSRITIALPVIVLVWAVLILAIASMSFLFTGYFFNWPIPVRPNQLGQPTKQNSISEENSISEQDSISEKPPSVLSTLRHSIPRDAIPESGPLKIGDDNLLSGDGVHYADTSNFEDARQATKYIVIHRTETKTLRPMVGWFQTDERAVSAHVIVDKDGTIVQMMPFDAVAFHCPGFNNQSIGVEVVGEEESGVPNVQLHRLVSVLRLLVAKYPDAKLVPHSDVSIRLAGTSCPGSDFPFAEVKNLVFKKGISDEGKKITKLKGKDVSGVETLGDRTASKTETSSAGVAVLFQVEGKIELFGGPQDSSFGPDEGLALVGQDDVSSQAFREYFLPQQPPGTTGLGRRLNPEKYYVSCRWNYDDTPKELLRKTMMEVTNPRNGKSALAKPVDWGPLPATNRVASISPGLAKFLGLHIDDVARISLETDQVER
jgi:N-acetyl-anhydromuramyl-L-alanine amidase AmpD